MNIKKIQELADLNAKCLEKRTAVNEYLSGRIETLREQAMGDFRDFFRSQGWTISSDQADKRQVAKYKETVISLDPTVPTILFDQIQVDSLTLKISSPQKNIEILIMEAGQVRRPTEINRNYSNDENKEIELVKKEIASIDAFLSARQDYVLFYIVASKDAKNPYLHSNLKFRDLLDDIFKE